jgi:hypothetical protein
VSREDIQSRNIERISYWWSNCKRSARRHGLFLPGIFYLRNILPRKRLDILGSNFSVHTSDFAKINGYDERIIGRGMEDDNLAARFALAGIRVRTVAHEALQYHLYHAADPIPHDRKTIERFRDNPESFWTPCGMQKTGEARQR